jgi:alkyl hydroperoxide reductase subunit AhpC
MHQTHHQSPHEGHEATSGSTAHPAETSGTRIEIGIGERDRTEIAEGLARLLADTYTLYLKTHNCHWNVTGPMFQSLHLMFETQYTELALAVDQVAERIRTLGVRAPASYREFAGLSSITEDDDQPDATEMIRRLVLDQGSSPSHRMKGQPMGLHLGDTAPDFTAMTTDGEISFRDWKEGSWAVLFSHPADFTPVCTTELGRTAALQSEFAKRNTKALALSVDPVEEHHRWAPDIGEVTGTPLNFPIVADPDHKIAELYDMIHPGEGDTSTVRSVFIVDPDNKLRLMLTYPKSVGRNFDEIIRVIDALQATDANPIATPADWQPGERVIVALGMSTEDAKEKFDNVEEFKPYLRYADAPH